MAISCGTEEIIETGESVSQANGTRNVVKLRVADVPDYIGRREVDDFRTIYYGLGVVAIGDFETGDASYVVPIKWMPVTFYLPAGIAGNVTYSGPPNVQIGVTFCTV